MKPYIESMQQVANKLQEYLQISNPYFEQFAKSIQQASQVILRALDNEKKFRSYISKSKWPIFPYLDNMYPEQLDELTNTYKKDEKIFDKFFVKYFEYKDYYYLKKMIKGWENNKYFKQRKIMINQALRAHELKLYFPCINTLIPLIEGIMRDFAVDNHIILSGSQHNKNLKMIREFAEINVKSNYEKMIKKFGGLTTDEIYAEILLNQLFINDNNLSDQVKINRHVVCHNFKNNYANKTESTRLFCILDYLFGITKKKIKNKGKK